MFETLSGRLSGVFDKLTRQGALTDEDVATALREVRVALLEADVSLPVARDFIRRVQEKASGQAVTKSVTPGQQVVKIVHDELIRVLAGEAAAPALKIDAPPAPVLMVGLQGSGKTTTTAKLALRWKDREGKRVLMASLDTRRPAAMQQLAVLGSQIGVDTLPIMPGQDAVAIAKRAKQQAALGGLGLQRLLRLLDQRDDVAHAEDAARHLLGAELLERVHLLAEADEADRPAGDRPHRQRRAAAAVAVHAGQQHAGDADLAVELLGDVDRVLAGQAVDDQQRLVRPAGCTSTRS